MPEHRTQIRTSWSEQRVAVPKPDAASAMQQQIRKLLHRYVMAAVQGVAGHACDPCQARMASTIHHSPCLARMVSTIYGSCQASGDQVVCSMSTQRSSPWPHVHGCSQLALQHVCERKAPAAPGMPLLHFQDALACWRLSAQSHGTAQTATQGRSPQWQCSTCSVSTCPAGKHHKHPVYKLISLCHKQVLSAFNPWTLNPKTLNPRPTLCASTAPAVVADAGHLHGSSLQAPGSGSQDAGCQLRSCQALGAQRGRRCCQGVTHLQALQSLRACISWGRNMRWHASGSALQQQLGE